MGWCFARQGGVYAARKFWEAGHQHHLIYVYGGVVHFF